MEIYVGYGFDTGKVPNSAMAAVIKKYDHGLWTEHLEALRPENEVSDNELETLLTSQVDDMIDDISYGGRAGYLADVINAEKANAAGTDYIVSSYDKFLVFDACRFAEDSARTKYIKTQKDFVQLIGKYLPTDNLTFGNLYEGSDYADPIYWMD